MTITKLIIAAGFAVATTGAFAETGVKTTDFGNVSTVNGRASIATVKIQGDVNSTAANVADSGREVVKGDTQMAVTAGDRDVNDQGRS